MSVVGCSSAEEVVQEDQFFDFQRPLTQEEWYLTFGNSSYFVDSQGIKQADEMMESGSYRGVEVGAAIDWFAIDELADRNAAYSLNGFKFISPFFKAYEETGDETYARYVLEMMMSWISVHPMPYEGTEWGWHDDATARRVFYFTMAMMLWEEMMTDTEKERLKESLAMQVDLLTTDEFYKFNHNHGVFQDQAMVLYALALESGERQKELLALAMQRSGDYFAASITSDGVHKEHSPSYHYGMARMINWFALAYQSASPTFSSRMSDLNDKMARYATHLVMPNLNTPSIGDSPKRFYDDEDWHHHENYLYAITGGIEGEKPTETDVVFEEGGYGILRSSWEDSPEEATWMLLNAATHSGVHKHNDDLSFLLYHGGELFVEAGSRNYDYQNPYTNYCYQSYGHNVLIVDETPFQMGITLPSINEAAKETNITAYDLESDIRWVQGQQQRFNHTKQTRTLSYNQTKQIVTVSDLIESTRMESHAKLLYHLAEEIEIELIEDGWNLYREKELVATVQVKGSQPITLSSVYGEGDGASPYQGLIFEGELEPRDGYVLMVDMACFKGQNEVVFEIRLY